MWTGSQIPGILPVYVWHGTPDRLCCTLTERIPLLSQYADSADGNGRIVSYTLQYTMKGFAGITSPTLCSLRLHRNRIL